MSQSHGFVQKSEESFADSSLKYGLFEVIGEKRFFF